MEKEIKDLEEVLVEEIKEEKAPKQKTKQAICNIKFVHQGYVYFIFEKDTMREPTPILSKDRVSVNVEYSGTYGKPDFKIIRIY